MKPDYIHVEPSEAPPSSDANAQQLEQYWSALVDAENVNTPRPDGLTPGRTDPSNEMDNFELLRRLFEHRQVLAHELARDTSVAQQTRRAHERPADGPALTLRVLGDYELLEQIGRGGMGVVYKARQLSLGRIVALKHMRTGKFAYAEEVQRFKLEVETAARLQHPNIVAIHEVGVENGEPYFSMDYIAGRSLSAIVREQLQQPAQAARYVAAIALAVEYAHSRGVIHRDLKPANILINAAGVPLITDFGLAKLFRADEASGSPATAPDLTQTGDLVGTPSYMSPEQALGDRERVGPPSDIYSLGAILYELVTGRPPFRAETSLATLKLVLDSEAVSPRLLNPQVPRDFENICLKCLAKEPEKRYATAQLLADDLQRFVQGQPVLARPIGAIERLLRLCRRHPQIAALSATAAVLLLTIAAVASAAAYREAGLRRFAVQAQQQETTSRLNAEESRNVAQLELADGLLRRGMNWCEQGEPHRGLLFFAQCLEALPSQRANLPRADQIEQAARLNLAAWTPRIHQLQRTLKHEGRIDSFAASADGSLLITGGTDGNAQVWKSTTGERRGPALVHGARLRAVAISPDGKSAATAGTDELVKLWRIDTGALVRKPPTEDECRRETNRDVGEEMLAKLAADDLESLRQASGSYQKHPPQLEFTADGSRVVTNCGQYPILDATTGHALPLPKPAHERSQAIALSRKGDLMIAAYSAGIDTELLLLNTMTGIPEPQFQPKVKEFWSMTFSADGQQLIVGTRFGLTYYDLATGAILSGPHKIDVPAANVAGLGNLAESQRQHRDERTVMHKWNTVPGIPKTLDVHPYLPMLFIGTADAAVMWNLTTHTITSRPYRHQSDVFLARLSSTDQCALTAGHDHAVRYWDLFSGGLSGQVLHHSQPVIGAALLDRDHFAVAARDGQLRIWKPAEREVPRPPLLRHGTPLERILQPATGIAVATNGRDGSLKLWNSSNAKLLAELKSVVHSNRVHDTLCVFNENGELFCARSSPTEVQFYDARDGALREPTIQTPREVLDLALSRTGRLLATTLSSQQPGSDAQTQTYEVLLWDTTTGKQIGRAIPVCANVLAFSPDEKWLATASVETHPRVTPRSTEGGTKREVLTGPDQAHHNLGNVQIWNATTGEPLGDRLPITTSVWRLAVSPDSRLLAVSGFDQSVYVWDVTAQKMAAPPLSHQGGATSLLFAQDGRLLISGGRDGNVRVWTLSEPQPTGHELIHYAEIAAISLSPDDSILAVGCVDNTYRFWHLPTGEPIGPINSGGPIISFASQERLLVQAGDGANLFPVPQPLPGTPAEISAHCRKITGHEIDRNGRLREWTAAE